MPNPIPKIHVRRRPDGHHQITCNLCPTLQLQRADRGSADLAARSHEQEHAGDLLDRLLAQGGAA